MDYTRQQSFHGIGKEGQEKLKEASVAIIGVGALGCVCSELLARAGIGKLMIYDFDKVEGHNLHRQTLYCESDVGKKKAEAAKHRLTLINPEVKIEAFDEKVSEDNIIKVKADVLIDCLDDLNTKLLVNDHCVEKSIPLVHGSVAGSRGYLFVVKNGASLRDIYSSKMIAESCETSGVLNTIVGAIASMQANEALKIILGADHEKDLIRIDLWKNTFEKIEVKKRTIEKNVIPEYTIKRCKTKATFEVIPKIKRKMNFEKLKKTFKVVADTPMILILEIEDEEVIVYEHGELMFKSCEKGDKIRRITEAIYSAGTAC